MTNKNILGFGKDNDDLARVLGISGVGNNELKILSLRSKITLLNIYKELKKFNVQLALINDYEISKPEVDAYKNKM